VGGTDDAREPAETSPGSADTATAADGTFAFEHSAGVTQVPVDPQRIATTTDQNALLPLLELGVTPVASAGLIADDGSQTFRRTEGFDTSGIEFLGAYGEPNFEAFAAADPDLIVGYEFDSDHYDTWSDIAPTVLVQIFERPLTDALVDFGTLVGREEQAEQFRAGYDARIEELSAALEPVRDELSISVITSGDPGQFWRADEGQAIGTVMGDLALLRPEPQDYGYHTSVQDEPFSLENIGDHDADVVLVIDFRGDGQDPGFDALVDSPLYQQLGATRADQAYVIDGTRTVGAAWARMDVFLDELEAILLADDLDTSVVDEAAAP
jgi:iron complex transport system substrate-binding protein